MIVERYCAGQVVFFSVHEPALNAAAERLYVPIATKNFKTAPHLSTLRLQSYYLNARPGSRSRREPLGSSDILAARAVFARGESMKAYAQDVCERVLRAVNLGRERRRGCAAVWRLAGSHQAVPETTTRGRACPTGCATSL